MSQQAVRDYVEGRLESLDGVIHIYPKGAPDTGVMPPQIPALVMDLIGSSPADMTLGGSIDHTYEIRLTLYLGQPSASSQSVKQLIYDYGYDDQMITLFQGDHTLGGTCDNSRLTEGADNLDTYRVEVTAPKRQWRLFVTEYL